MRAGTCVHFTGVQNVVCKCNIRYDYIRGDGLLPCLTFNGKRNDVCSSYTEPTPEQIAANDLEVEQVMARMRLAMGVVGKWKTWTKKNRVAKVGEVECPICKGKLHLSQAAYNGHVWGKCETKGCLSWMQ